MVLGLRSSPVGWFRFEIQGPLRVQHTLKETCDNNSLSPKPSTLNHAEKNVPICGNLVKTTVAHSMEKKSRVEG